MLQDIEIFPVGQVFAWEVSVSECCRIGSNSKNEPLEFSNNQERTWKMFASHILIEHWKERCIFVTFPSSSEYDESI